MKKLMFVAAMVGSTVAFGADASNFEAEDGVYSVSFTQKYLEPTLGDTVSGDDIEATGETARLAEKEAKAEFNAIKADYKNAKIVKTTTEKTDDKEYTCTIKWTYTTDDPEEMVVTGAKAKSVTIEGILVKGNYDGEFVTDGTLFTWAKCKDNVKVNVIRGSKYVASLREDAEIASEIFGKKSLVTIGGIFEEGAAVGFGTANDDGVKTASGNFADKCDDSDAPASSYGTWKIKKDATATKMATLGCTIEQILNKKGATEFVD